MKNGFSHFSFGCKSYKQSESEGPAPTATPIKHQIPHSKPENIREPILNFTAHFGEINPDIPYLCRRGQSGAKREVFAFSPLFGGSRWKKNVKSSIFRKKQVNFWVVYLLRLKLLIINKNMMMHRKVRCKNSTFSNNKQAAKQVIITKKPIEIQHFIKMRYFLPVCYGFVGNMP